MSLLLSVRKRLILPILLGAFPVLVWSQIAGFPQGNESYLSGPLVGDQIRPSLSLNQNGGYLVWEENGSRKTGSQIVAVRLNSSFTQVSSLIINKVTKSDQVNPQVQLLNNGDAIFIWQSYGLGNADIYARILKDSGTFATGDIRVNSNSKPKGSYSKDQQSQPAVCALQDGSAFVTWQSVGQDGNMFGIYGRIISETGSMASDEFLINQTTNNNQRTPAVARLANGNVAVAWISQFQRFGNPMDLLSAPSIDVYARLFDATGNPISDEKLMNSGNNICANPCIAPLPGGGFTIVWSEKDASNSSNSWDVVGRSFSAEAEAVGADFKINTTTYGDQFRPKIATVGNNCAVVWTSLGQDGSREGVFGRLLQSGTQPVGDEFSVNTTTRNQQIHPTVAASGTDRFLVGWSGFSSSLGGGPFTGFDIFGRKYILNEQQ